MSKLSLCCAVFISITVLPAQNALAACSGSGRSGNGTLNNLRIDHNTFSNYATSSIAIFLGETSSIGKYFGLIDHNTFNGAVNFMGMKVLGPGDPTRYATSVRGTGSNIFLEDNTFDFDSATDLGSGCIDAW